MTLLVPTLPSEVEYVGANLSIVTSNGPWALVFRLDLVGELCCQHFDYCECLDGQLVLSPSAISDLCYCFWSQLVSTVCVAVLMQCSHVRFHCHYSSHCGHPLLYSIPPSNPSNSPQNMFQTLMYLAVLGALTFIAGNRLLSRIAQARK